MNKKIEILENEIDEKVRKREELYTELRKYIFDYQENEMNYLNEINELISKIDSLNRTINYNLNIVQNYYIYN